METGTTVTIQDLKDIMDFLIKKGNETPVFVNYFDPTLLNYVKPPLFVTRLPRKLKKKLKNNK